MKTLKMDDKHDLIIEDNVLQMIEDRNMQVQTFKMLLGTRKGEYFLNTKEGLDHKPFFESKKYNEDEIRAALQDVGMQIKDFVNYEELNFIFDDKSRTFDIELKARFSDRTIVEISQEIGV